MNCPSCSSVLRPIEYEGTELHTCDGCGGEFVSPEALAHVVNTRDAKAPGASAKPSASKSRVKNGTGARRAPVPGVAEQDPIRKLTCAACASPTTVFSYALDTGVRVDRCSVCGGVWLDKDELEHIQEILEEAEDNALARRAAAAAELERARRKSREVASGAFEGSRFSFVNAIVNRFLDAA